MTGILFLSLSIYFLVREEPTAKNDDYMYYMDEIESGNYEYEVIEYDYDESLVSTYYWLFYSILFCQNKINRIIFYRFINEKIETIAQDIYILY